MIFHVFSYFSLFNFYFLAINTRILIELNFISSGFTQNPTGTIKAEFLNLPILNKTGFYKLFFNDEIHHLKGNITGKVSEFLVFNTKKALDYIILEYYESGSIFKVFFFFYFIIIK